MKYNDDNSKDVSPQSLNTNSAQRSSRLPGFYQLPISERAKITAQFSDLTDVEFASMTNFSSLTGGLTDVFIENAVGTYSMPLGIATNFLINGKDYLIPMAVEETSVLAAASHGAKLARYGGGFNTSSTEPIMTGQIQVFLNNSTVNHSEILATHKEELIRFANKGQVRLTERGGGAKDLSWKYIDEIKSLIVYLHVDTRDAMGANIVNTMCEKIAVLMLDLFPNCETGLRILTNLCDRRLATARCRIPASAFDSPDFQGVDVISRVEKAYLFAKHDIYRATTNNKGVMNGIDPVVIATGNDWRAVEAGAHAYCVKDGTYQPMARWHCDGGNFLCGQITLPMAVGTVGGVTKLHPTARAALKILGNPDSNTLAEIICTVGLAQNLSALRALASEGIQKGHMHLHRQNLDLLRQGATRT
ncbi:MAG: hydroxymethylglutaryl-CoA reductase, degradative [Bdellovibrionota bacterium]